MRYGLVPLRIATRWYTQASDANALDLLRGRSDEHVAGLGLPQRCKLARSLMTTSTLKEFFTGSTTVEQHRRELYLDLENHPWTGKFQHGVLADDDMLWNELSNPQLAELERLLGSP